LFRYLSERYTKYPEKYPYDIVMLNNDLRYGRRFPGRGLYMDQVAAMFGAFGLEAEPYTVEDLVPTHRDALRGWASVEWSDQADYFQSLLVSYIESGLPPVIGIEHDGGGHAAVAFGIGYQRAPARHRTSATIPASDFVASITVNDDNWAPYRRVLRDGVEPDPMGPEYAWKGIDSMVVPLPDKLLLAAQHADLWATSVLNELGQPDVPQADAGGFIRRLVATSSRNYKAWKARNWDWIGDTLLRFPLPHFLWLCEVYTLNGWTTREAVAEVALDGTAGLQDRAAYLWIRYPNKLWINESRMVGGNEDIALYDFSDHNIQRFRGFFGNLREAK
jgi:hypothetical protein